MNVPYTAHIPFDLLFLLFTIVFVVVHRASPRG